MNSPKVGDFFYRYEGIQYAREVDEWDNPIGQGRKEIRERCFTVIRVTPKGVWLQLFMAEKWVSLHTKKRYAHPTKEEALKSFIERKKRQARILESQWHQAEDFKRLALYILEKEMAMTQPKFSYRRCPSIANLMTLEGVDKELALKIRLAWKTDQYLPDARALVDHLFQTYGVEYLGILKRNGHEVYYCNAGDTYTQTILFIGSTMKVGCWGDLIEANLVNEHDRF